MSKSAAVLGLVAVASAAVAPAYGSESAPAYGGSSAPAYGGSSSAPVAPVSSSAPAYGGSSSSAVWSGVPSSSAPAYPGSSSAYAVPSSSSVVYYPSSSSSYYPSSSSAAPTTPPFPGCWSECFQEAGISSESDICGNAEVATCIHDKCDCADTSSYFSWYNSYCEVPSSSSSIPYYGSSSSSAAAYGSSSSVVYYGSSSSSVVYYGSSSSSVVYYGSSSSSIPYSPVSSSASAPPSQPTIECWGKCFAENGITSEDQLCGNTAVDACISEGCDCEDDKAYWAWYESYCPAPSSSSASPTTPTVPATPTPTDCWSQCFEEAGIASEDELCGNTAVDQCISSTCSPAEDKAYWEWYLSYCPSTGPVTTPCVTPTGSATPSATPSSPVDSCWSSCFAENDVTSEASLCGNDDVSKCIHDTCSAAEDKAYWDWYNGFCVATSTGTTTVTTAYTPLTTPYSPVTTTYVSTETYGWGPATSGPATGLPTPPASPPAPYGGSWSPSSAAPVQPAGPTGTGYASPSASQWAPVPATGAGAVTKPGVFFAAAMALAALF